MTQETFKNTDFANSIDWAIVKFCQEHKRDIPLQKMIEGQGNVEGNANQFTDAYGQVKNCLYANAIDYNNAVEEWNKINGTVEEIIRARLNGRISSYITTIQKHGASVFSDLAELKDWQSFDDVPEQLKESICNELVRRQLIGFNKKPEKIELAQ